MANSFLLIAEAIQISKKINDDNKKLVLCMLFDKHISIGQQENKINLFHFHQILNKG